MIDERLKKIADKVIDYSLDVQPNEKVVIETSKNCSDILKYMIKKIALKGAIPYVVFNESGIRRELVEYGSKEQFEFMRRNMETILNGTNVYINMLDSDNCYDMSDVSAEKKELYQKYYFKPIYFDIVNKKTRWITVDYPSMSSAQQFSMSTDAYEDYFFNAMNVDYKEMAENMEPLKEIIDNGNHVKILSNDTNLDLDIKKYKSAICAGKINLPDGEIFIGPDLDSVEGYINFNTPNRYQGNSFNDLYLKFEKGKVVDYSSSNNIDKLGRILNSDEANKYVGEFAIGTNPNIDIPRSNILFDEKILGSLHIALGNSHDLSDNGNRSPIHWDIVKMLTEEFGGGKIIIDDELIQENGIFIPKQLKRLNRK